MNDTHRYPDYLMPIAGAMAYAKPSYGDGLVAPEAELVDRFERFSALREDFLMNYGYNTARAYWSDLDDLWLWCEGRQLDVLAVGEVEQMLYFAYLRELGFSENTIRRRGSCFRGFYKMLALIKDA